MRPYEEWVFTPEPYLVTVEEYGERFPLVVDYTYDADGTWQARSSPRRPDGMLGGYHWYGVPELFPFTGMEEAGLASGELLYDEGVFLMDEAYAMEERYYSMAVEYDTPDGTRCWCQDSNYPQFRSWNLGAYRWYWSDHWDGPFLPKRPEPYRGAIELRFAELNWIFLDTWEGAFEAYGDNGGILEELTAAQNDWLTEQGIEERAWIQENHPEGEAEDMGRYGIPESDRFYAVTGLTILNGDSRTEADYFAGSRAKTIRISVDGEYTKEIVLADSPAPQLIALDHVQPTIAKPLEIAVEVLDSYPGETAGIYITEIGVGLDSNLPQGR